MKRNGSPGFASVIHILAGLALFFSPAVARTQEEPPGPSAAAQSPAPVVAPLASRVAAVHWKTAKPTRACVEYSEKPIESERKQGQLFPLKSMSADQYTKAPCRNHDLLVAGLAPDTLYHLRVWNKAEDGAETASPAVQFRTPPKPPDLYRPSREHWGLQLSEPWCDLDAETRAKAVAAPYLRMLRVRATWGELQPEKPDRVSWKVLEEQLAGLEKESAGKEKFIKLSLAGARHVEGKKEDTWFLEGVEILQRPRKEKAETKRRENKPEEKENVVRWDSQYLCRWLSLVKTVGNRLDPHPAEAPNPHPLLVLVAISSVSNTGEMAMTPRQ